MCIKGRSPNLRYVPRTHRVDLDWLIERIKIDPGVNLKYVETNEQMADLLTKASFTVAKWNSLLRLHQIGTSGGHKNGPKPRRSNPQNSLEPLSESQKSPHQ